MSCWTLCSCFTLKHSVPFGWFLVSADTSWLSFVHPGHLQWCQNPEWGGAADQDISMLFSMLYFTVVVKHTVAALLLPAAHITNNNHHSAIFKIRLPCTTPQATPRHKGVFQTKAGQSFLGFMSRSGWKVIARNSYSPTEQISIDYRFNVLVVKLVTK